MLTLSCQNRKPDLSRYEYTGSLPCLSCAALPVSLNPDIVQHFDGCKFEIAKAEARSE